MSTDRIVVRWMRCEQDGESSEEEEREHGGNEDPVAEEAPDEGSAARSNPTAPDRHSHRDRPRTKFSPYQPGIRFSRRFFSVRGHRYRNASIGVVCILSSGVCESASG